jgi:hypothetical protein
MACAVLYRLVGDRPNAKAERRTLSAYADEARRCGQINA